MDVEQLRIGISSCLLGEKVRYDGGRKLDRFLVETLGRIVEFVPVCPEVECGLPVPREPMQLAGDPEAPRLVTIHTRRDLTEQLITWAGKRVGELEREGLHGFIFKCRSPSCGLAGVPICNQGRTTGKTGSGVFTSLFIKSFPLLPVEDEERIRDAVRLEKFLSSSGAGGR